LNVVVISPCASGITNSLVLVLNAIKSSRPMIPIGYPYSFPFAAIVLSGNVALQSMAFLSSSTMLSSTETFEFGNGSTVLVENPMRVNGLPVLMNPEFLGVGSGGAVFSYQRQPSLPQVRADLVNNDPYDKVAVKISWLQSASSVRNECNILHVMDQLQVSGVERCLAQLDYQADPRRAIIILEPVVEDAVGSVAELPPKVGAAAIRSLMVTMAQMLAARVVTADVQPLISKSTGTAVLIDMTEARSLPIGNLSDTDKALVREFCSEMLNMIPEGLEKVAPEAFFEEARRLESESGIHIDGEVRSIIDSFLSTD
jgi:hypothetical protein